MAMGAQHSPDQSQTIAAVTGMLEGLRDSLNGGKDVPEHLAVELLRVRPPSCNSTVDMFPPDTDLEGDSGCNGAPAARSAGVTLREILNDASQLHQLAQAVSAGNHAELRELLRREVPREVESHASHDLSVGHGDGVVATQIMGIGAPEHSIPGSLDASGFDLASVPGGVANNDSFSFQVIEPDEVSLEGLRSETGTLERAFAIRVDEGGTPIVLGRGGMGYVVTGSPLSGGAEQAIKVCSDPKHEPRMLREFEILSQLTSEGFPLATGKYRDAQGQLCYSMKLVRGDSYLSGFRALHEVAKDPRSTDKNAVAFIEKYLLVERPADGFNQQDLNQIFKGLLERLIDVATAVSTMHKKGFIHRDLKPDNVRIELDTRHAVILDFGLAKVQDHEDLWADSQEFGLEESMHADLTRAGSVMGTFAYMSPEQASGNSDAHTKATDIYALGAMLYYLMSGRPAVSERDQHGKRRNPMEVLKQIRNGDIEPPVRLSCIRADFADLEAICSKAMAKDPSTRYGSADEMIIDLRAWVSGNAVRAYQEVISGGTQMRYRFHHWTRQNPGVWNAARTAALGVLTVVGGGGYYSASQSNKANAVASVAEGSLLGINEEVEAGLQQFLGSHTIETVPVEQLDTLVSGGEFEAFLKTERKRLADEILQGGVDRVLRYAQYRVVSDIITQAKQADERLARIEDVFAQRSANRVRMRQELAEFREEFAPIRDFLGNDFDSYMTDLPQERIDIALARYLPAFQRDASVQGRGQAPKFYFPECFEDVRQLVLRCADQELSGVEVAEIKESVATLLSYKVLNLQRTGATGYAPHVRPLLPRCSEYLEEARRLKGGRVSIFDLVLWERVTSALGDPRRVELLSKIRAASERALREDEYAETLSSQDLGILAKQLVEEYRYAEAEKLFGIMLVGTATGGASRATSLPSRYFGEYGKAYCGFYLAREARRAAGEGAPEVDAYLDEASGAFQRAVAHLSGLPEISADRRTKVANVFMGLARIAVFKWEESQNPRYLRDMQIAHERAREAASGARLSMNIAINLFNVGEYENAAAECSKAVELAPYLINEFLPLRARCYAALGREAEMLGDVETVLNNAKSQHDASTVEPMHLSQCALTLAVHLWGKEAEFQAEKRELYLEKMKHILTEVKSRCSSGTPYALEQLDLDTEFFQVLKNHDPTFWDDYVTSVSSGAVKPPGRK